MRLILLRSIQSMICATVLMLMASSVSAHHPHAHERIFAEKATRAELKDAYLSKCAEVHHLAQELQASHSNCYQWKTVEKAFGIGAVVALSASLIVYIATR